MWPGYGKRIEGNRGGPILDWFEDKRLIPIAEKVFKGKFLSLKEGLTLYQTGDFFALGYMADQLSRMINGPYAYFVVNRHINPTNLCVNQCCFCAFYRREGEEGAYQLTLEEILAKAAQAVEQGARELHIVGGLHPTWPLDYYLDIVRKLKEAFPRVHVKAYTAVEVEHMARISGLTVEEVLSRLKEAGLDSMPGGGAEVFSSRIRKALCPKKTSSQEWLRIHKAAHRLGIKTNCTLLYGHMETLRERVEHLIRLREAQEEAPGFQAFIPLAFHPENTPIPARGTTGMDDLKTIAVARLMLPNIPHIKAYWVMLGEKTAQVALAFGADDLEGTVVEEKITHMAGATSPQFISRGRLIRLIRKAGKIPVERDALYNRLRVYH